LKKKREKEKEQKGKEGDRRTSAREKKYMWKKKEIGKRNDKLFN